MRARARWRGNETPGRSAPEPILRRAIFPTSPADLETRRSDARTRRWFSLQPNVTGRGIIAGYSVQFWLLVVAIGVITGLFGSGLMALLRLTEHVAFGYQKGPFLDGVALSSGPRRILVLLAAGVLLALGFLVLHRVPVSGGTEVSEALWLRGGRLPFRASLGRALLSIVTVGMGVSLGREAAPQLAGAATASGLSQWAALPQWQRRLLVAAGTGGGFAAVYNVPLGGALFALEVLLGTVALPLVLPALAVSVIATAVAWTTLGTGPTYRLPEYAVHPGQLLWALLAGPLLGIAAVAWVRVVQRANGLRPTGRMRFVAPLVAFAALGTLSLRYPELLGNGKGVVQLALLGRISLGLFAVLAVLKPLATATCLGSGAPGGLFTPTLTVGTLLSGVLAGLWALVWPAHVQPSYALIGGGAFLAAAMQGPLSALVLVLELTRHFDTLMAPTLIAVTEATVVARRLGAPSIYSARLLVEPQGAGERTAAAAIATLEADPVLPPVPDDRSGAAPGRGHQNAGPGRGHENAGPSRGHENAGPGQDP